MPRIANTHTQHEKNLMARGKATRAKAASKRAAKRDADLLDTTIGSGGTDTTPTAAAAPTAPPPTRNQAFYRSLVKQAQLKSKLVEHFTKIYDLASQVDPAGHKACHAEAQRNVNETDKATIERRIVELLQDDPDADK